ncbi:MAG: transglutaminase domain-containing protein [Deltaproteobacteria bacterium]|nr:transglutaminase domain-containing protein [Deltaproteobacteria bacterium]
MTILTHPAFESRSARFSFWAVILLRSLFFTVFIFSLNRIIDLGTPAFLVSAGAIAGVFAVSMLAFTNLRQRGFFTLLLLGYLLYSVLQLPLHLLPHIDGLRSFLGFDLILHLDLILGAFALSALSTWAFWKFRHALTFEILALCATGVYLFAGHRNFHFDNPQIVHSLAWSLKLEQLSTLIGLGTLMVLAILTYVFFATLPGKPVATLGAAAVRADTSKPNVPALALLTALFCAFLVIITTKLYSFYSEAAETRIANGVGEASNEGMTPLGFHSALGSTNQPSALVRLEGDYKENPFSPMMYMRESALSQFNGHELTIANRTYDQDVSNTSPAEAYATEEDPSLGSRVPLVQSVYLLTDHKLAFAVDYPTSIVGLKNPNPSRFKGAFRAYSIAPGFPLQSLAGLEVGDPKWSPATRDHYLYPHPDHRYAELAQQITEGYTNPVEKAAAIVQYLSKNAIYTLTPNHEVKPDEDPVAPFLFGDKRGYCVHFAHATVYMLRALGIPARIGTGYLTDLSQAKDGHILLRMSDRHAWAEVYVAGHGWIPFDTQPEQVENHADTQVDMKVLEELMGLLDPGEEILPKDATAGEKGLQEPSPYYIPGVRDLIVALILTTLLLVATKLYLRFGWALPGNAAFKLRRSYIAVLSTLHDLGYRRDLGETRDEFRARVRRELGVDPLTIAPTHLRAAYARDGLSHLDTAAIEAMHQRDREKLSQVEKWKLALAALNPASVFAALARTDW